MTNRVNWTPLVVFTLAAFALGCLAGTLVVKRHQSQSLLAAELIAPDMRPPGDARHGTEVEIGKPTEAAPESTAPAATPVAPHATPPTPARTPPRPTSPAEMVYPVPLPAPVAPSPADVTVIDVEHAKPILVPTPNAGDRAPVNAEAPATISPPAATRARIAPLEPPQHIRRVAPEYPRFARINNIEGTVVIAATIDTDGKVTYPRVVKSFPMLDRAALDAVQQWQFKPGTRGGQPVPVEVTLSVEFSLR